MMNRRYFLTLTAASTATLAMPARAAELSLDQISTYVESLRTATARFVQINDDGSRSSGTLYILRPGRIRFEYDAPDESLVIAGQGQVAVFDARSNQRPQEFQLANTPLKLLLRDQIDLADQRLVRGTFYQGGETIVVAQDPEHPEYGSLQMHFSDAPALTRWVVLDGSGAATSVYLSELETGMRFPARLFDVKGELAKRGF